MCFSSTNTRPVGLCPVELAGNTATPLHMHLPVLYALTLSILMFKQLSVRLYLSDV